MHDIRAVRSDPAGFDAALARRGLPPVSAELLAQDSERRAALTALQEKQARRNALAREVGQGALLQVNSAALTLLAEAPADDHPPPEAVFRINFGVYVYVDDELPSREGDP